MICEFNNYFFEVVIVLKIRFKGELFKKFVFVLGVLKKVVLVNLRSNLVF